MLCGWSGGSRRKGVAYTLSHSPVMGNGYPKLCKHNAQGNAQPEMPTKSGSHCWRGAPLHEGSGWVATLSTTARLSLGW